MGKKIVPLMILVLFDASLAGMHKKNSISPSPISNNNEVSISIETHKSFEQIPEEIKLFQLFCYLTPKELLKTIRYISKTTQINIEKYFEIQARKAYPEYLDLFSKIYFSNQFIALDVDNKTIINQDSFEKFINFLQNINNRNIEKIIMRFKKNFFKPISFKPIKKHRFVLSVTNDKKIMLEKIILNLPLLRKEALKRQPKTFTINCQTNLFLTAIFSCTSLLVASIFFIPLLVIVSSGNENNIIKKLLPILSTSFSLNLCFFLVLTAYTYIHKKYNQYFFKNFFKEIKKFAETYDEHSIKIQWEIS